MATAHPKANFQLVFRELVKFLGVADPNYPEGDEVLRTSPYTKEFLRKKLVDADIEVILLITSIQDHPYRNQFFTEAPNLVAAGARIPAYMGVHGGVEICVQEARTSPTRPEIWNDGDLAQSFDQLKRARFQASLNKPIYPPHPELYWIENGKIELIKDNLRARISVPTIPVQNNFAPSEELELFTPWAYQSAPLAKCLSGLRMVGSDSNHRNDWERIWQICESRIYGKALNLPEPERLQRIAA